MHQMDRQLAMGLIKRAPQRLAVDGDQPTVCRLSQVGGQFDKALTQRVGIEPAIEPFRGFEGLASWRSVRGQTQHLDQPRMADGHPVGDLLVVVAATEHGHERAGEQLGKRIGHVKASRVRHRLECAQDTTNGMDV